MMNNKYEYITKCGLKVIYIKKMNFARSYCGIGCNYGGSNLHFSCDGKDYESLSGIAHFIECSFSVRFAFQAVRKGS